MSGYIKLHRRILNWEWYGDHITFRLFIHLLLNANYTDSNWKGIEIKRGQRFTSINHLATELNVTPKKIRVSINKLKRTNEIATEGASNGTMITICKYDSYQLSGENEGQTKWQTTGQTEGKRRATNKKNKNNKEIKEEESAAFAAPSFFDIVSFFKQNGYSEFAAKKAFDYYQNLNWHDSKGRKVSNWKAKMKAVWFKPENSISTPKMVY